MVEDTVKTKTILQVNEKKYKSKKKEEVVSKRPGAARRRRVLRQVHQLLLDTFGGCAARHGWSAQRTRTAHRLRSALVQRGAALGLS